MQEVSWPLEGAPHTVSSLQLPYLQRQVYLQDPMPNRHQGRFALNRSPQLKTQPQTLVYAVSWWNLRKVQTCLKDTSKPIWASLSEQKAELYREINNVYCGHWPELQEALGADEALWGRDYVFWHQDEPLTVIKEVFSPALCRHLGPMSALTPP